MTRTVVGCAEQKLTRKVFNMLQIVKSHCQRLKGEVKFDATLQFNVASITVTSFIKKSLRNVKIQKC